jgi:hypothetical protein
MTRILILAGAFVAAALCVAHAETDGGLFCELGEKDAPIHALAFVPASTCQQEAVDVLKALAKEYPRTLRVTVERMNSDLAQEMEIGCASYLLKVAGKQPPRDHHIGDYAILFQKSPEVGHWTPAQLKKKVTDAIKAYRAAHQ